MLPLGGSGADYILKPSELTAPRGRRWRESRGKAAQLVHSRFPEKQERRDDRLVLSDLRMGLEPEYIFRYVVAEGDGQGGGAKSPSNNSVGPLRIASAWPISGDEFGRSQITNDRKFDRLRSGAEEPNRGNHFGTISALVGSVIRRGRERRRRLQLSGRPSCAMIAGFGAFNLCSSVTV